jgi:hypothetical protein
MAAGPVGLDLRMVFLVLEAQLGHSTDAESGEKQLSLAVTQIRREMAPSASTLIDKQIADLKDWRGKTLAKLRKFIHDADPDIAEEWKWGTGVYSHHGLICTGETYKNVVKMTFSKGASLDDPSGLFNSCLEGSARRAIDFHEGDKVNEEALKTLIRAAVALNTSSASDG